MLKFKKYRWLFAVSVWLFAASVVAEKKDCDKASIPLDWAPGTASKAVVNSSGRLIGLRGGTEIKSLRATKEDSSNPSDIEKYIVDAINRHRESRQLRRLVIDPGLCASAREHSEDMRTKKTLSHRLGVPGRSDHMQRAKRHNTTSKAENIAGVCRTPETAFRMWLKSAPHLRNIEMDKVTHIGIGQEGGYYTLVFGYGPASAGEQP